MKRTLSAFFLLLIISTAAFAQETKTELARTYVKLSTTRENVEDVLESIFDPKHTGAAKAQIEKVLKSINFSAVERVTVESVSRRMTETELKAAISYLTSPEGKSVIQKQREVAKDIAPIMQQEVMKAMLGLAKDTAKLAK